jgi:hypothetical protein
LTFVLIGFLVSRTVAYGFGVRFNPNSIRCFTQIIDPVLLRSRLLESLFYLHSQPPLFNLLLGVGLKLFPSFPSQFGAAMHVIYLALGLALSVGLYRLLVCVGIARWPSATIAVALSATPAFILYENWLFYEYPVAALLILSALAIYEFLRRETLWSAVVFFTLLAAVIYIRSIFQIIWMLLAIGLLLATRWDLKRRILAASALPALLVIALMVKNFVLFGMPVTSSWFGMNLAQVVDAKVPLAERQKLVRRGELSRVSLTGPFEAPVMYLPLVQRPRSRHVPVLDELRKSTGCWNQNNAVFIPASSNFFHDAIKLIRLRPGAYARAILKGVGLYIRPFNGDGYVDESKIHGYVAVFDRAALLQVDRDGPAWTILLTHVAALLYGLRLTYRLLRRRVKQTASAVTLAYVWLTLAYVTLVVTFTQVVENGRIRFFLDPLVVVLLAAAARDGFRHVRRARLGFPSSAGSL